MQERDGAVTGAAGAVLAAARARADALAAGDGTALRGLLHPSFAWTTHLGQHLDRDSYVARNTGGTTVWRGQALVDPEVVVVGDTAVLRATVEDVVLDDHGRPATFRMPVTMVWLREAAVWRCLAGHAGPRTDDVA